jgi:hypothetical protein
MKPVRSRRASHHVRVFCSFRAPTRLISAVVAGALLALPGSAHADGDPASDVLISDTVFVGYQAPSAATTTKLRRTVAAARKAGQPVRVAVIQSPQDLGALGNLWGHPREYARLLAQELGNPVEQGAAGRREELIVVMPAGYGTSGVPASVERDLRNVEIGDTSDPDALGAAAGYGVQELAKATGHPVPAAFAKPKTDSGGSGGLIVVLVVVALLALVIGLIVLRVRSARAAAAQSPGGNT